MRVFCETCHDMREYTTKKVQKHKNIKGTDVFYTGEEAYCKKCGNEVFVSDMRDNNLAALEDAYNKSKK